MNYAVVDTGSNTIRMSVYKYENENLSELYTEAVFANLAGHIIDNRLSDDGIDVCCEAILHHRSKAKEFDAKFYVFATAAIRNAQNCEKIVEKVKEKTGINLEILSGLDEGELSFLGAVSDFPVTSGVMADVGGGSSEVILFSDGKPVAIQSVPIGSLKAYKTFVAGEMPTVEEVQMIKDEITKYLNSNEKFKNVSAESLCLVGGGVRAAKKLSELFLGREDLDVDSVKHMLALFVARPDTMEILERTTPKRKLTITPGLAIYSAIGEYFGANKIYLSDKGIKEGYAFKYLIY